MPHKTVCDECIKQTGGCCTDVELSIHVSEIKPFKERFANNNIPDGHKLTLDDKTSMIYLYSSNEKRCMFLTEDNKCSIYESRPVICRMYPILWSKNDQKKILESYLDFTCALTHFIPIKDFYASTLKKVNSLAMNQVGELDFNPNNSYYVNLTVISSKAYPRKIVDDPSMII